MDFIWLNVQIQTARFANGTLRNLSATISESVPKKLSFLFSLLISSILPIFCHGKLVNKHNEEKTQTQCKYFCLCCVKTGLLRSICFEFAVNGKLPANWLKLAWLVLVHLLLCLYAPAADLACIARVLILVSTHSNSSPVQSVCWTQDCFQFPPSNRLPNHFRVHSFIRPRLSNHLGEVPHLPWRAASAG